VARYREALSAGFRSDSVPVLRREQISDPNRPATFTARPGSFEHHPLNQVAWQRARDLCRHYGGDLPTEAQWEYAAVGAGRDRKATYPWGEALPSCSLAVVARSGFGGATKFCPAQEVGPEAVDSVAMAGDVNALGVVGLGGNVGEWTRDPFAPFDHPCWSGPIDPSCIDDPIVVGERGGAWNLPHGFANSSQRGRRAGFIGGTRTGFRCAYPALPTRRWRGP
jgi:formylglycine-generating enzyme required for sulfatase activity